MCRKFIIGCGEGRPADFPFSAIFQGRRRGAGIEQMVRKNKVAWQGKLTGHGNFFQID